MIPQKAGHTGSKARNSFVWITADGRRQSPCGSSYNKILIHVLSMYVLCQQVNPDNLMAVLDQV
jgi:hypothetical protein